MYQFSPEITDSIKALEFRPHMLETAWDYYSVAHQGSTNKGYIKASLSCLSLEIILKSFNSKITKNKGKLNEKYQPNQQINKLGRDKHNLFELLSLIDEQYKNYLFSKSEIEIIIKHKNSFLSTRYGYEESVPLLISDDISKIAASVICKMVYLYKHMGCEDPFITRFNCNEVYFNHVQKMFLVTE